MKQYSYILLIKPHKYPLVNTDRRDSGDVFRRVKMEVISQTESFSVNLKFVTK